MRQLFVKVELRMDKAFHYTSFDCPFSLPVSSPISMLNKAFFSGLDSVIFR